MADALPMTMITAFCLFAGLSGMATACATAAALMAKGTDSQLGGYATENSLSENEERGALITAPSR